MRNPWLDIPLADYEGHMSLPAVDQARLLADVFDEALAQYTPRSVAVLGCTGGNGFDRAVARGVRRVVGVDLNPDYVAAARARYSGRIPGLELYAGDVETDAIRFAPVDLVYAALLFEYVDPARALDRIRGMLRPNGVLVVVLQLPGPTVAAVTPSRYESIQTLAPCLKLVPPSMVRARAEERDFRHVEERVVDAMAGKQLQVQVFRRMKAPA
ncbi:MAG TPA: class I SAM-dependent methyltransferase [Candidatus Eisenbacteria bacterium]|nr:class I SAM-dependent methyltransferase [Candidatus Eisenbacteria bacterium]